MKQNTRGKLLNKLAKFGAKIFMHILISCSFRVGAFCFDAPCFFRQFQICACFYTAMCKFKSFNSIYDSSVMKTALTFSDIFVNGNYGRPMYKHIATA